MTQLDAILDAGRQQLSLDELLAILEAEERDESPPEPVPPVTAGADPEAIVAIEGAAVATGQAEKGPGTHDGLPSGWLWQLEPKDGKAFDEALVDAVAAYRRKFGRKPRMIWAHPSTGDGDRVSHDERIGRGYLLLGPLPGK